MVDTIICLSVLKIQQQLWKYSALADVQVFDGKKQIWHMLFSSKDTTAANKNYKSTESWMMFKSLMAKHRRGTSYIFLRTKFSYFSGWNV